MSEQKTGDGWTPLADNIARQVQDYLDGLDRVARGEADDRAIPLLLLEVSQILLAGAQLGASTDVILPDNWEPEVGEDPDLDKLRSSIAERLGGCDTYAEVFDPYADVQPLRFRLSDDLADVAADVVHGLKHYQADRKLEALWWWQYSYISHWGTHAGAALRALHSIVAHARLDVDDPVPTSG